MAERLSLVAEPRAALVSPSDTFLPLGYLHVGEHPGGGWYTWGEYCRLGLVVVEDGATHRRDSRPLVVEG